MDITTTPHADSGRIAPLYRPDLEHDSCGVGLVVDIAGRPSRSLVELALAGLVNLTHRGGVGADQRTGDGAGVLTQIPTLLRGEGVAPGELAVAMTFLPRDSERAETAKRVMDDALAERGIVGARWREVPVDPDVLGDIARSTMPGIAQLLIERPAGIDGDVFERDLMLGRRAVERAWAAAGIDDAFVVSCSARTIIYKGFCLPEDLGAFYLDLQRPDYDSAIALFHQRYSTNTLPTWAMAQPFRFIAHNGEINTIQGNRSWMLARRPVLAYPGVATRELSLIHI